MSSDGLYSSQANLALKGIVGLYAMGQINKVLEARGADPSKTAYYLVSDTSYLYSRTFTSLCSIVANPFSRIKLKFMSNNGKTKHFLRTMSWRPMGRI